MKKRCKYLVFFFGIAILSLIVLCVYSNLKNENQSTESQPIHPPPQSKPFTNALLQEMSTNINNQICKSNNMKSNYLNNKQELSKAHSAILLFYDQLKLFQAIQPRRGFYAIAFNSGIFLWEAISLNQPLTDSSYKQILLPQTQDESFVGVGELSKGGIYIVPDVSSNSVKFLNMKLLNSAQNYLVTKTDQSMVSCFIQSQYTAICCGNKTLMQYDLSSNDYNAKLFYYNAEGNYFSCSKSQSENILIGGFYGALTILDKEGNFLSVNKDRVTVDTKGNVLVYYIEIRPNIIINGEKSGLVINNIADPEHIIRTYIPNTNNSFTVISLRHKEGYFASGGGIKGGKEKDAKFYRRVHFLEADNKQVTLIREKVTPTEHLGDCFIGFMKEIHLGCILFQIYCDFNQVCIWNYAEDFEIERVTCIDNQSEDLIINFLPILPPDV